MIAILEETMHGVFLGVNEADADYTIIIRYDGDIDVYSRDDGVLMVNCPSLDMAWKQCVKHRINKSVVESI